MTKVLTTREIVARMKRLIETIYQKTDALHFDLIQRKRHEDTRSDTSTPSVECHMEASIGRLESGRHRVGQTGSVTFPCGECHMENMYQETQALYVREDPCKDFRCSTGILP